MKQRRKGLLLALGPRGFSSWLLGSIESELRQSIRQRVLTPSQGTRYKRVMHKHPTPP